MKHRASSDNCNPIAIFTNLTQDADTVQRTLAHVYPGVRVRDLGGDSLPAEAEGSLFIIDTTAISGAHLEHFLEEVSRAPVILVANDLADARALSHLLTGRRSVISRADLKGMGLIQNVHHLLERQRLHEQLSLAGRRLKELSIRDELTQFFNHRHLDEVLASEVKKSNRYRRPLAVVIAALRNFASINESAGPHGGDRVLIRAAEVMRKTIREADIPARYGDDEFAVILPESDEGSALKAARRIQEALSGISVTAGESSAKLVTGFGVAALSPSIRTKEELLRAALSALIEAKKSNGNAICASSEICSRKGGLHENRRLMAELAERVRHLSGEAERNYFQSVMKLLVEIPAAKKILLPHSERVAFFAQRLAEEIGMPPAESKSIHRAGFFHDAGKVAISEEIVSKPGRLSSPETELMKQHPELGIEIIGASSFFKTEIDAILYHHERFDGLGYPKGISGLSIPLSARVLAIAEAWDTMVTPQVYRMQPMGLDAALMELKGGAGGQFDPALVDKFAALIAG